jgi:fatty-acyl-CoA synthase
MARRAGSRSSGANYPLIIKRCLLNVEDLAGENTISYRGETRFSYGDLVRRVARLGSALMREGVRPGDTVAVMEWDSNRYLECFYAIPMLGAVLQTVNVRLSPDQIRYTLEHSGASFLLSHTDFAPLLQEMLPSLPNIRGVICLTDDGAMPDGAFWRAEYEALLATGDPDFEFPEFDENLRATTFYTSGTTGKPKGVYYSHRQLVLHTVATLANVALGDRFFQFSRDTVYMPITPMFHAHAWGLPFVATMAGCKQVYPGRYVPEKIIALLRDEKVTYSHCVPTLLHMLLTSPAAADLDLSHWTVLIGGSALPAGLARMAMERGINVLTGFGMSETGPMLTLTRLKQEAIGTPQEELSIRTKVGLPIPLVEVRIVDDDMRDAPRDGVASGEIVARAPWLTEGYHNDPAASKALWRDGYLHTQDLGQIDRHGYLRIADRAKDIIKTGGEWVSSLALEDLISRHDCVSEVGVIAMADPIWGERPMAIVVLKADRPADAESITSHLMAFVEAGDISKYALPSRIEFVDLLNRTSVGKLDKKALRQRFLKDG